jgi:hypothetical protein
MVGSQGSVEPDGMPQSSTPGIGGGKSNDLIRAGSSGGSSVVLCPLTGGKASETDMGDPEVPFWGMAGGRFVISSERCARG